MLKIHVIAAVVDTQQLTLYKKDGTTHRIPQGDPRIRDIIKEITPVLSSGGTAEILLKEPNSYKDFEEKTNGLVKLFRIAKAKVAHIFASPTEYVPSQTIGVIQNPEAEKFSNAVEDIMAHAEPVTKDTYLESDTNSTHTMIAVVDNKIIPGVENLKDQIKHANKLGSTKGVENFLKRIAKVIDKRGHSVEELLQFMEKGDLPIADDGSIIAYKRLYSQGNKADVFVDPHTRKVTQKVGTHVFMSEKLVDPNRRNECSNGLHIGRRRYMGSFSGDVMVICKIAPEDVIAVPEHDRNKMRVCGYHILAKLSQNGFDTVCRNQPMTEHTEDAKILGQAIRGEHVAVLQTVEITEGKGGGLKIVSLVPEAESNQAVKSAIKNAEKGEAALALDDAVMIKIENIDPKEVAKTVKDTKEAALPEHRQLFIKGDYESLLVLKKKKKVSWERLGFSVDEILKILRAIDPPIPEPVSAKASKPESPAKVKKTEPKKKELKPVVEETKVPETNQEKARKYFDQLSWSSLWLLKRTAKKTWSQLGFTAKEEERIKVNKPDHV